MGLQPRRPNGADLAVGAWVVALTAVVIGPMARSGWVLTLDWVTGPAAHYQARMFDGAALPAGPLFFGFAALAQCLGGAAVGWLVPATSLLLAGWAAGRCGARTLPGRLTAVSAAVWNPFVHERLYAGQVAMLAGYAVSVGLMASVLRARGGRPWLRWGLWWAAAAACSAQFVVLAGLPVIGIIATRRRGCSDRTAHGASGEGEGEMDDEGDSHDADGHEHEGRGRVGRWGLCGATAAVGIGVTVLWLAAVAPAAPATGGAAAAATFATRADPRLGLALGTVLQRGFWRASPAAPGSWGGWGGDALALLVLALALAGARRAWRTGRRELVVGLGGAAVLSWVLCWGPTGPMGGWYRAAVDHVVGFGLFREAGKFVVVLTLATVVLVGVAIDGAVAGVSGSSSRPADPVLRRRWAATAMGLAALAPLASSPTLAWGVGGRLAAVHYPAGWATVDARLAGCAEGSVLVLPLDTYVAPGFVGRRVVANPAPAYFGPRVVVGDDAKVAGLTPSSATRRLQQALEADDPRDALHGLGIAWVLALDVEAQQPVRRAGMMPVFSDGELSLWRVAR